MPKDRLCYTDETKNKRKQGETMQERLMTKTSDYYYDLPQELIAQTPLERRDSSRLMVLNRRTGEITHGIFTDIAGVGHLLGKHNYFQTHCI